MRWNMIADDASEALPRLLNLVLEEGADVPSRAGATMELTHLGITLGRPWRRELLVPHRKPNIAAQVAETMWVLAGRNDVPWLANYLPRAGDFSDDGEVWRAGYGPRLRAWEGRDGTRTDQVQYVVDTLRASRGSRQAVMSIWDPHWDTQPGKDIACNNWLSFSIRNDRLDLMVAIRSNDAIWGWSGINQFEWSALQEVVAGLVGAKVGQLHFAVTSWHLYDRHYDRARKITGHYNSTGTVKDYEDSPRFEMPPVPDHGTPLGYFTDVLCWKWFELEGLIREGHMTHTDEVDAFPEPMLRSWLRVIQWWWTGELRYIEPLKGTRLHQACAMSVQPKVAVNGVGVSDRVVLNMLRMVKGELPGDLPTEQDVSGWTMQQKMQVAEWAGALHLRASDNTVDMPTVPDVLWHRGNDGSQRIQFAEYVCALHDQKHAAYGDSWKRRGEMLGIMANIARKIDRLDSGGSTADETQVDTAVDLLVYLAKYRVWLLEERAQVVVGTSDSTEVPNALIRELSLLKLGDLTAGGRTEAWLVQEFNALETLVTRKHPQRVTAVESMAKAAFRLAFHRWQGAQHDAVKEAELLGFVGGDYDLP